MAALKIVHNADTAKPERTIPVVDFGLQALIPPLSDDEYKGLEADILREGCRDELTVWKEEGVLLDGHNRLTICCDHDIDFRVREVSFASRDEAESWIIGHQLNRRNLHPDQISRLRGKRYNLEKKKVGAPVGSKNRSNNTGLCAKDDKTDKLYQSDTIKSSADKLATEYKVGPATIMRDANFAEACDTLDKKGIPSNEIIGRAPRKTVIDVASKLSEGDIDKDKAEEALLAAKRKVERAEDDKPKPKKQSDEPRYGFRLMVTNQWRFPSSDGVDDRNFDGGISSGVVANLVHYFTDPGDVVVDPMAGSGRTGELLSELRYFSDDWKNTEEHDNGGPRTILLSDIAPTKSHIVQADAAEHIPFENADFILLDPPYWKIAEGKYAHGGDTIEEWVEWLTQVGGNCHATLKEGGMLALVLDDYLRSKMKQPLVQLGVEAMTKAGFKQTLTVYNNYANSMKSVTAIGMWRAKRARLMLSGMKVISVFNKGDLGEDREVETLGTATEVMK